MCLVPGFAWQSLIQGRIANEEICLGSHLLNLRLPSQAETNRAKRFVDASPTGTPLHAQSHGDGKSKRHHCARCALIKVIQYTYTKPSMRSDRSTHETPTGAQCRCKPGLGCAVSPSLLPPAVLPVALDVGADHLAARLLTRCPCIPNIS